MDALLVVIFLNFVGFRWLPFFPIPDIWSPYICFQFYQVPPVSYPRLVQLLRISSYSRYVLSGLVISTGGLQESLSKASVTALLEYLQVSEGDINEERNVRECMLSTDFLWILQQYQKCDRVVTPAFKVCEYMVKSCLKIQLISYIATLQKQAYFSLQWLRYILASGYIKSNWSTNPYKNKHCVFTLTQQNMWTST